MSTNVNVQVTVTQTPAQQVPDAAASTATSGAYEESR